MCEPYLDTYRQAMGDRVSHMAAVVNGSALFWPSGYIHSMTTFGINYSNVVSVVSSLNDTCLNTRGSQTGRNQWTHGCEHAHNKQSSSVLCG